ncbi:TPA: leucine--tRNA ligase [Candidatus Peregrinibacteria bacterium]|nr:leucine--tRNA ligase [Candidatus Peregrinibacteria bacterium]
MKNYAHSKVEKKWRADWSKKKLYKTDLKSKKPKYYNLVMFPYPSGDKLHIGHWYSYAPADSWGRYMTMKGFNVFQPIGFDSFGLPAENYAIKTGIHPAKTTKTNIKYMRKQLGDMGAGWDWDAEVVTCEPDYYRWTQWIFIKMYEKGLVYKKTAPVNWCPGCKTVLANEQAQDGTCERCDSPVTKKDLSQWFFAIKKYAEELLNYDGLDWPEKTRLMQEYWIGKSYGVDINFKLENSEETLVAYTTRPDTLYSVTFIVIAPEHPIVDKLVKGTKYEQEVKHVAEEVKKQNLIERASEGGKNKIGAFTGKYAINPATGEKIPVYIANFVLMYGTGIVMADAHDQRDFEFARKYKIPLKFVISKDGKPTDPKDASEAFIDDGILFNSGEFSGINNKEALPKMASWLEKNGNGKKTVNYKLRDWLISRQRYWGAPIPVVYCDKCGEVPVPEKDLPVLLPTDVDFKPSGDGKSPLNTSKKFINTTCPKCKSPARRETETMDTFVCSSWYFLRYPSGNLKDKPFDTKMLDKWLPVDMYIGGPEHACMHLLYARFIHKALHDLGYVESKEPFKRLVHQGMITKDGAKMSKSKGNVVSPDEFVKQYGSDVFRMYLMFMGPFTQGGDWNDKGIMGIKRFVDRFWKLINEKDGKESPNLIHKAIKKVTEEMDKMHFNTAISTIMELINGASEGASKETKKMAAQLIAPLAPHLAEECWMTLGEKESVFLSEWPKYDPALVVDDKITIAIQVNGKLRGTIEVPNSAEKEFVIKTAKEAENIKKYLVGMTTIKEIYVPGKLISLVVKPS